MTFRESMIRAGMIVESKTPDGIGITAVKTAGTVEHNGRRVFVELIGGGDEAAPWNLVNTRWAVTILKTSRSAGRRGRKCT